MRHTVLGTHNWPNAEKVFPDVGFLQHEHHHDFTIWVECDVKHKDRDIEFIMLRVEIMKIIDKSFPGKYIKKFGSYSCEMIADFIKESLELQYGKRNFQVSIFEDNIQGAII